jgi:hypothetical protein
MLLSCLPTLAATTTSDAEARYRSERAACENGQSAEDKATCLREAAAAREAARHGELDEGNEAYARNALARCQSQPPAERDACVRRARGEGETSGSVRSGGILREYREIILPPANPQNGADGAASESPAPAPDSARPPAQR